ncbi:MAG: HAD family hydrolase [Planctomycetaceae bacterium]
MSDSKLRADFQPHPAIVFDLDGTLIDSLRDIAEAANASLRDLGFPIHPIESYRQFVGDGVRVLFERALPVADRAPTVVTDCAAGFARHYAQGWSRHTRLYPGIGAMLDEISRRGIRLAVLSNKPHPFTCQCVKHFLSAWNFEVVAGQKDGIPKKPDPAGAWAVAQQLGFEPARLAYVGDSSVDMQTATNAGLDPIGVSWGFRSREELWQHGARVVIDEPRQLLDLETAR